MKKIIITLTILSPSATIFCQKALIEKKRAELTDQLAKTALDALQLPIKKVDVLHLDNENQKLLIISGKSLKPDKKTYFVRINIDAKTNETKNIGISNGQELNKDYKPGETTHGLLNISKKDVDNPHAKQLANTIKEAYLKQKK